jgi:hypothetical protein
MHTFLNNLFQIKFSSTCFEQAIFHYQEVCTSSLQYFITLLYKQVCHLQGCLYRPPEDEISLLRNLSRTIQFEINYFEECAARWSLHMCIKRINSFTFNIIGTITT